MNAIEAVQIIKEKFECTGSPISIPLLKGKSFTAEVVADGVRVDNLGNQPFLPWAVFQEAVCVLIRNGGRALKGDAMTSRLGEADLPFDSIEGHIASVVYGNRPGESVFRRITPVSCILIWAGICENAPRKLILREGIEIHS